MATTPPGAILRHIRNLAAGQKRNEQTDRDLLRAFLTANDQPSFEILVRRHGTMVLRVCRRVLGQEQDAEDAFQATFLVLARQAASIRKRTSLASWLHGVAYRMATNAGRAAARRRKHQRQAVPKTPADPALTAAWQEIQVLLDEEVERLPETVRGPFVLCCLENRSGPEVARQLGLEEGTLWKRLSRARQLLRKRLAQRGVALTTILTATAVATQSAGSTLPPGLLTLTVTAAAPETALSLVSPNVTALMKGMMKTMFIGKLKIVTAVLLALALAATGAGVLAHQVLAAPEGRVSQGKRSLHHGADGARRRGHRPTARRRGEAAG